MKKRKKEMKRNLLLFLLFCFLGWRQHVSFGEEFCVCQGSLAAGGSWINSHMAYVFGGSVGLLASPCLFNDILSLLLLPFQSSLFYLSVGSFLFFHLTTNLIGQSREFISLLPSFSFPS
jgi:hypothetical protein